MEEAQAAAELGESLGRIDSDAIFLDVLLTVARSALSRLFVRGYLFGLVATFDNHAARVTSWLDAAERDEPEIVAELAMTIGPRARPLDRALRMFDRGVLPAAYLASRNFTVGRDELSPHELAEVLDRLAAAAESGDQVAERVGLDAFVTRLPYETPAEPPTLFDDHPELARSAWRLLEARPRGSPPESHWWKQIVVALAKRAPDRAVRLAAGLLTTDDLRAADEGEGVLTALAPAYPTDVMEALGRAMLDEQSGWRFFVRVYRELIDALPSDVVRAWIQQEGVEAARRVARHLPPPRLVDDTPSVPDLTLWVLTEFEDDDRTFQEFCAGVHSFQTYSGDIAAQHDAEAAVARRFLDYPARRIREWASREAKESEAEAELMRQWEEERDIP